MEDLVNLVLGIGKLIASEVDLAAARERYGDSFDNVARDLDGVEDMRVLDFNSHQIMANFSLRALGDPIKLGELGGRPEGRPRRAYY